MNGQEQGRILELTSPRVEPGRVHDKVLFMASIVACSLASAACFVVAIAMEV
jgi:hypothetical protein